MADLDDSEITAPGKRAPSALDFDTRYQTRFELARGGMGRVLIAWDGLLNREVAVKELLRKENVAAVKRFEREALLTARLQHPGIVSVYELARRPSGEQVLVMRRVRGKPFEQAISEAQSLDQRLILLPAFISACDAVAYAHREGVVHRDLKPGNVLLGDFGDTVVIDWGLAKEVSLEASTISDEDDAEITAPGAFSQPLTAAGAVLGTPSYMAPEQARGEAADARTDVYALGAMLYQLLSGKMPYRGVSSKAIVEAVRTRPPEPLASLVPALAPELSTIAARAMSREPADRYATAAELAEELKRFQAGRLVLSHSYRTRDLLRRWARRHTPVLVVSVASLVLLAASASIGIWRILKERDRANREAEASERVSDYLTGMFKLADPGETRGNTVTAREILDRAARDAETALGRDPLVQARLMHSIGTVYLNLGLLAKARPLLDKAVEMRRRLLAPGHPDTIVSLEALARLEMAVGRRSQSEELLREVVAERRRSQGPRHPDTLRATTELARVLLNEGRQPEAESMLRETLAVQNTVLGKDHRDTLYTLHSLAWSLILQSKTKEGEELERAVVEDTRRVLGAEDPDTLRAMNGLAAIMNAGNRPAEAEPILREVVTLFRKLQGPEHPRTLLAMHDLAVAIAGQGHYAEAERMEREVLAIEERTQGRAHADALTVLEELGTILLQQGKLDEAHTMLTENLAMRRSRPETNQGELAGALYSAAMAEARLRKRAAAIAHLEEWAGLVTPRERAEMARDPDLASLHGDPAFEKLVAPR